MRSTHPGHLALPGVCVIVIILPLGKGTNYMDSRTRLSLTLNHTEPDRVPLDLGGIVSGITLRAHRNLLSYLGLPSQDVLVDRIQQLVKPAEDILERCGVDTRYCYLEIPEEVWRKDREGDIWEDEWGVRRRFTGLYFDMISHPLGGERSIEDIQRFIPPDPPSPAVYENLSQQAEIYRRKGQAVMINLIGSCFEFAWYLRGFVDFLTDLALEPGKAEALLDIMLEFQVAQFSSLLDNMGEMIDVVLVGDDLATQNAPFLSPELYRCYVKPRQHKLYRTIKSRTQAKLFYHSCGAVASLIPDLIEIGVDILNPVQVAAAGMDPVALKREFGKDIVFWGGVDTQRVLPFGSTEEVREEVRSRIDQLAAGGGYVLAAVHNLQADVPAKNIVAMFEEALDYGSS